MSVCREAVNEVEVCRPAHRLENLSHYGPRLYIYDPFKSNKVLRQTDVYGGLESIA